MSPVRTRPASSRSLHRFTTLRRPWPSHTYVIAVAMSYPATGPALLQHRHQHRRPQEPEHDVGGEPGERGLAVGGVALETGPDELRVRREHVGRRYGTPQRVYGSDDRRRSARRRRPRRPWSRPGARACRATAVARRAARRASLDLRDQVLVDRRGSISILPCRPSRPARPRGDELLDLTVGDVERVEDLGLGDLVGAGLDHQDRLVGTGHDEVEVGLGR